MATIGSRFSAHIILETENAYVLDRTPFDATDHIVIMMKVDLTAGQLVGCNVGDILTVVVKSIDARADKRNVRVVPAAEPAAEPACRINPAQQANEPAISQPELFTRIDEQLDKLQHDLDVLRRCVHAARGAAAE